MSNSMFQPPVAALVAAAGFSRRMGAPKQLLPWGERTVIASVVETLALAGAQPVVCITGHRRAEVEAALAGSSAQIVFNPDYAQGEMLRSYQVGIRALEASACMGVLIALGDQPHIPEPVIRQIIEQAQQSVDQIVIPSYAMRRGHPFYIPRRLWPELLALGGGETLRALVHRHTDEIAYVDVATDAILRDMDTPAAFQALAGEMRKER